MQVVSCWQFTCTQQLRQTMFYGAESCNFYRLAPTRLCALAEPRLTELVFRDLLTGAGPRTSSELAVTVAVISEFAHDKLKPALCLQFLLLTMAALDDRSPWRWNQTAIENWSTLLSANHVRRNETCGWFTTCFMCMYCHIDKIMSYDMCMYACMSVYMCVCLSVCLSFSP